MFKHNHNKGGCFHEARMTDGSSDQCDHCHKETPYYLLTVLGSGEAVCIECLAYVEDEYDHITDDDFED